MNFTDFTYFFNQTAEFARQGTAFVYVVAVIMGIWLTAGALNWIVQKGRGQYANQGGSQSWFSILARLMLASCMITLARMMSIFENSNGSVEGAREVFAYLQDSAGGTHAFNLIYSTLALWCVFIGTIGFLRGFVLFDKASRGEQGSGDMFWRGIWHVVGGSLVVQIFS